METPSYFSWPQLKKRPKHIAFILDGNGSWAQEKGLSRIEGHKQGRVVVKNVVKYALQLKIPYLSLYVFSTENWQRPQKEVSFLLNFLSHTLEEEILELHQQGVKLKFIQSPLDQKATENQSVIQRAEHLTKDNKKLCLQIMFNYGAKSHIIRIANQLKNQSRPFKIEDFDKAIKGDAPDPDILIRTGKQRRLSNFMLWELAYSELFFLDMYWPDFKAEHLLGVLQDYQNRERRFGKVI